jgi:membrane-associated PAP2 superfamily phosphatase
MSGNYLAGAVWPPVLQHFIDNGGWRQAYTGNGVFCLLVMLPLALAVAERVGQKPAACVMRLTLVVALLSALMPLTHGNVLPWVVVQFGGMALMATLFGMALGGWMSGAIFDLTGSYQAAFINGIGFNLLNIGIVLFLLKRARGPGAGHARAVPA